jgi:hypothetical protein
MGCRKLTYHSKNSGLKLVHSKNGVTSINTFKKAHIALEYRIHDPEIGRFFAIDPLTAKYPHYTPYSFSGNKVIHAIELEGLEEFVLTDYFNNNGTLYKTEMTVINDYTTAGRSENTSQLVHRSRVDIDANGDIRVQYVGTDQNALRPFEARMAFGTDNTNTTNLTGTGTVPTGLGSTVVNGEINITTTNGGTVVSNKNVVKNNTQTMVYQGVPPPANDPSNLNNIPAKKEDRRTTNGVYYPDGAWAGTPGNVTPTGHQSDFQFEGTSTGSVNNSAGGDVIRDANAPTPDPVP